MKVKVRKRKKRSIARALESIAESIDVLANATEYRDHDVRSGYDVAEAIQNGLNQLSDTIIEAAEIIAKLPQSERRFKRGW